LNQEEFISSGLLELYATGISSVEETRIVEDYLKQFPELREELKAIEISLENYAKANAIRPSSSVKEKVFDRIFPDATVTEGKNKISPVIPINRNPQSNLLFKLMAAASFILLLGSIALNYTYYHKYSNANEQLQIAQQKIDHQEKSNLAMTEDLNVMTNKYAQPVVLNGTPHAPDALAKIFWMKNTGQVYIDPTNLPQVPEGKQYQLWAIVDGKPIDGGMIATEKGIYHIQKMKSFGKVDAFAITLEKEGGSPTPTMDEMIVSAKM
jgi:anti-sigma-K factor RskA